MCGSFLLLYFLGQIDYFASLIFSFLICKMVVSFPMVVEKTKWSRVYKVFKCMHGSQI